MGELEVTAGTWLIPWRARGPSGSVNDNFLWKHGRVYVMDNHRLALWCWWQHLGEASIWKYLHIDRHYDAFWQTFNPWAVHSTPEHRASLDAFRSARIVCAGRPCELYRWDTITSALWSLHRDSLREIYFATAKEGDSPEISQAIEYSPWELPNLLASCAEGDEHLAAPCIVNIDLDYFSRHDFNGRFGQVFSDEYIEQLGGLLHKGVRSGKFGVVTVALSPETTGSWELAERLLAVLLRSFLEHSDFLAGAP